MNESPRAWAHHHARQLGTLLGLLALCVTLWILSPHFLTVSNLTNVAEQVVINAIIAVGMTWVIIMGGIDLSVGSILAFSGVVMGLALRAEWPAPLALCAGLAAGTACGAANGLLIAFLRLPPFIATLGMMLIVRGGALVATGARPVSDFSEGFRSVAQGEFAGFPVPVILMIAIYLLAQAGLKHSTLGRYAYAIGGNEEAAKLSGVNVPLNKILVYSLSGFLSAVAAAILTARINSAQPTAGDGYELDAIAAAVIGGTSLMGGQGSVGGTLVGALIMGVLRNGLNLLDVYSHVQRSIIGLAIIVAVAIDLAVKKRRS